MHKTIHFGLQDHNQLRMTLIECVWADLLSIYAGINSLFNWRASTGKGPVTLGTLVGWGFAVGLGDASRGGPSWSRGLRGRD